MDKLPYKIINGDSLQVLDTLNENSVDAIVTDPPYELGFMGKSWDASGIAYNVELWKKALKVLKPGGYLLAFGGSRTFHRIACAIEDAGFEIRDTIMWLYGSGFPKSMNIGLSIDKKNGVEVKSNYVPNDKNNVYGNKFGGGKTDYTLKATNKWSGWGTALKPAFEPVIVARKPVEESVVNNVLKYGVGGINIDECRVPYGKETDKRIGTDAVNTSKCGFWKKDGNSGDIQMYKDNGRFPANVILTYDETDFDEVCGNMPESGNGNGGEPYSYASREYNNKETSMFNGDKPQACSNYNDNGNACRYFYCAKASKKDRDEGLTIIENKNIHPTVKPVSLLQYLIRLVAPKGATILDIFNGSGSTGKAAMFENRERDANYKYIGIELEKEYCDISEYRIDYALNKYQYDIIEEIKENEKKGQLSLFEDFGNE